MCDSFLGEKQVTFSDWWYQILLKQQRTCKMVVFAKKKTQQPLADIVKASTETIQLYSHHVDPPNPNLSSLLGYPKCLGKDQQNHGEGLTKIIKNPKCVDKLKHPEKSKMCWSKPVDSSYEGIFHTPSSWKKPFQAPPSMKFPICAEFWGILGSLKGNVRKKICHEIFLPRWWFLPWWWYTTLKK